MAHIMHGPYLRSKSLAVRLYTLCNQTEPMTGETDNSR